MCEYNIKSMNMKPDGNYSIKVSLTSTDNYILILKLTDDCIRGIFDHIPVAEELESNLRAFLSENSNLLLVKLVQLGLGNETVQRQLKLGKDGLFCVDYIKWKKIIKRIKEEELNLILSKAMIDKE